MRNETEPSGTIRLFVGTLYGTFCSLDVPLMDAKLVMRDHSKPRRVIVFGGRDFKDKDWLFATLDAHHAAEPFSCIIEGGQVSLDPAEDGKPWSERHKWGAGYFAGEWAKSRGIQHIKVKAEWKKYGRSAGPRRNQRMIDDYQPTEGIGFPGGKGTRDMLERIKVVGLDWLTISRERSLA